MDDLIERLAATEGCTAGKWAVREHWSDETMREVYPLRDGSPKAGSWAEIADVQGFGDDGEAEAAANASLIALAPEMKARILSDAATIERLTRERDEARHDVSDLLPKLDADAMTISNLSTALDASQARVAEMEARERDDALAVAVALRDAGLRSVSNTDEAIAACREVAVALAASQAREAEMREALREWQIARDLRGRSRNTFGRQEALDIQRLAAAEDALAALAPAAQQAEDKP